MNDRGKFRINDPSYSSDSYFNADFNNINGVGWYESIQVNKQGGVLKAFSGLQFKSLEEINTDVNDRKQATYTEAN
jgi:hypothetical protein